jgi:hypothetical protein
MNPFPKDTLVLLKIWADEKVFQTKGKIIYSQPNMGAGVVFFDVPPEYLPILQHSLEVAAQKQ